MELETVEKNDVGTMMNAFREICAVAYLKDAILFDLDTLTADEINETKDYVGVCLSVTAKLDTIRQPLKIDVGFGCI